MSEIKLREERVNWRTAAMAVAVMVVGVAGLWLSAIPSLWRIHPVRQLTLQQVASAIFVTGLISILWDLFGRRFFLDEILAKSNVSRELRAAGIAAVYGNFRGGIDWDALFASVRHVDIFFAYGRTWRNMQVDRLRKLAASDATIRVILPDPDSAPTIASLAQRFDCTADDAEARVREAIATFSDLAKNATAKIEVWVTTIAPLHTWYRFDHAGVFSPYNHQTDRSPVPAILIERGGILYDFLHADFEAMLAARDRTRRIVPNSHTS